MKALLFPISIAFLALMPNCAYSKISEISYNPKFRFCDTCVTPEDFADVALFEGGQKISSNNKVSVLNARTGEIKTFSIVSEKESRYSINTSAVEIPTSSADSSNAQKVKENYDYVNNSEYSSYSVPADFIPSALDLIGNSANLNRLRQFMYENESARSAMFRFINSLGELAGFNILVAVDVAFANGSKAILKLTRLKIDGNDGFSVELYQVIDENGNTVPLTKDSANARSTDIYTFNSEESLQEFLKLMLRYGIRDLNVGGSVVRGGHVRIVDDCEPQCTLKHQRQ